MTILEKVVVIGVFVAAFGWLIHLQSKVDILEDFLQKRVVFSKPCLNDADPGPCVKGIK